MLISEIKNGADPYERDEEGVIDEIHTCKDPQQCKIIWECSLVKRLRERNKDLIEAMGADIIGAGELTGPIYHRNIRKVLGLPSEGSGEEILNEKQETEKKQS